MAVFVSVANFGILADFLALQAESPEEAYMQSEDLEIFLDVLYEEANPKAQQNYDYMIGTRDPSKMPWAALHPVDGEYIPAFYLLLSRREELEKDGTDLLPGIGKRAQWKAIYDLSVKMQDGWRPPGWATSGEDPYLDPYAKDPTTDGALGDDPKTVDDPETVDDDPKPAPGNSSQQTKPAVVSREGPPDYVKFERDMLLIGGGIGAAVMGGIWLTTSLLKKA